MTCRICLEPGGQTFCRCKGTAGNVHQECLLKWLEVSRRDHCEICNYTFQRQNKCVVKPTCTCTESDIFVASNVNNIVIIFVLGSFISTGFIFMYLARGEYLIINISWLITNAITSILLRHFGHCINIFILYTCFTTLITALFSVHMGLRSSFETTVLVNNINIMTLMISFIVWVLIWISRHTIQTVGKIMVYSDSEHLQNVDPPLHHDEPEQFRSPSITV